MDDKPLQVVRLRVEFETDGDRVACLVGAMDAEHEALREVLSIDREAAGDEELFDRFRTLGTAIAAKRGEALAQATGATLRGVGMVEDQTGMLARATGEDAPAIKGEFEVAVGQEGDRACAYLVGYHGQRMPPGASPALVSVPVDFMGDSAVLERFRALIEAIGICIVRTDMEGGDDSPDEQGASAPPMVQ